MGGKDRDRKGKGKKGKDGKDSKKGDKDSRGKDSTKGKESRGGVSGSGSGSSNKQKTTNPVPFKQVDEEQTLRLTLLDDKPSALKNIKANSIIDAGNAVECPLCINEEPAAAVSMSCGHWACYKCFLRVKFLVDENGEEDSSEHDGSSATCLSGGCPICKVKLGKLVITQRPEEFGTTKDSVKVFLSTLKPSLTFDDWQCGYDQKSSPILDLEKLVFDLFSYRCWVCLSPEFKSLSDLNKHMERYHSLYFCKTCLSGRDIFLSEHMCYHSKEEVDLHCRIGDSGLARTRSSEGCQPCPDDDETGAVIVPIKPHAKCDFCKPPGNFYYTHEALWRHMRSEHFHCYLCYEANKKNEFFKDASALWNHHCIEHNVCPARECLKQGIFTGEIVFSHRSQLEHHFAAMHKGRDPFNDPRSCEPCEPIVDFLKSQMSSQLVTKVTSALNGMEKMSDAELANLGPNDRPIFFLHCGTEPSGADYREEEIRKAKSRSQSILLKAPGYIVLPKSERKKKRDRYPDLDYGVSWQDYNPRTEGGFNMSNKSKDKKDATKSSSKRKYDADSSDLTDGDDATAVDNNVTAETSALTNIYTKARDYEKDMQAKMIDELPIRLLHLPQTARMDQTLNRPSFLRAIDAIFAATVGDENSCKLLLMKEQIAKDKEMNEEEDGSPGGGDSEGKRKPKVSYPLMQKHVKALSPLQLDSLSEMRNCLLEQLDTRLDLDKIIGLRALFFRTLRNDDNPTTPTHWLTWKHQGYMAIQNLSKPEAALTRIYISFCLTQDIEGYGGMDRAKHYPSLAAAKTVKEDLVQAGKAVFDPEARVNAQNKEEKIIEEFTFAHAAGAARPGYCAIGAKEEFPSLAGPGRSMSPGGGNLTMAETLKLKEQQAKAKKQQKKKDEAEAAAKKKEGVSLDNISEFPDMAPSKGLQQLDNRSVESKAKAKGVSTTASVFGAQVSNSGAIGTGAKIPTTRPPPEIPVKPQAPQTLSGGWERTPMMPGSPSRRINQLNQMSSVSATGTGGPASGSLGRTGGPSFGSLGGPSSGSLLSAGRPQTALKGIQQRQAELQAREETDEAERVRKLREGVSAKDLFDKAYGKIKLEPGNNGIPNGTSSANNTGGKVKETLERSAQNFPSLGGGDSSPRPGGKKPGQVANPMVSLKTGTVIPKATVTKNKDDSNYAQRLADVFDDEADFLDNIGTSTFTINKPKRESFATTLLTKKESTQSSDWDEDKGLDFVAKAKLEKARQQVQSNTKLSTSEMQDESNFPSLGGTSSSTKSKAQIEKEAAEAARVKKQEEEDSRIAAALQKSMNAPEAKKAGKQKKKGKTLDWQTGEFV